MSFSSWFHAKWRVSAEREYRFARRQSIEEDLNCKKTAACFDDRTAREPAFAGFINARCVSLPKA
jgi:hypothetical protein